MNRNEDIEELQISLKSPNLLKHSYAVEAIMVALAEELGGDKDLWGLAGLLHDIDYERTATTPELHSKVGADILDTLGIDGSVVYAVRAHNSMHGIPRNRKIDKALYAADPVSGLVTACALILPSKKLSDVSAEFVLKKMDEKSFAKGANREQIRSCVELELSLEDFIKISLAAMQSISDDLGL